MGETFVHPTAVVEDGASVGAGSHVWHHAHVRTGARVGEQCVLGKGVYIGAGVQIGDRCKIQNYALVFEGSTVEDGVFVGPGAQLTNDRYPRAITPEGEPKSAADWEMAGVHVEQGASIGAGAVVVASRRIGRWAMVGAGAVVTSDVGAHQLVAGNPARVIGHVCACGRWLSPEGARWRCDFCGREFPERAP
jgi:acetyltransferase-like isoleucine patch superfamily enzyme